MPRAILSTYDKTGLVEFAQGLHDSGWKLIASGGTARLLGEHDLPTIDTCDYTHSQEILAGRVKHLHPALHAGLLANTTGAHRSDLQKVGWRYIDMVVVNLHPFEELIAQPGITVEEVIESIDLGGVALLRSAARTFARVTCLCDPLDYPGVLEELRAGEILPETRLRLAVKAFTLVAQYDQAIANYLGSRFG